MSDTTSQRQCNNCKDFFPATPEFFYQRSWGLLGACKKCCRQKARENYYRPGARERKFARERVQRQSLEVRERRRAADRRRRAESEEIREKRNAYSRAYQPIYMQRPGIRERKRILKRIQRVNRQARKKSILGTHTLQQIQEQLKRQHHKCYYCSTKFQKQKGKYIYQVDHTFPVSRVAGSNIPANDIAFLVLTCPTCNAKKGNKFPWEFYEGGRLL